RRAGGGVRTGQLRDDHDGSRSKGRATGGKVLVLRKEIRRTQSSGGGSGGPNSSAQVPLPHPMTIYANIVNVRPAVSLSAAALLTALCLQFTATARVAAQRTPA